MYEDGQIETITINLYQNKICKIAYSMNENVKATFDVNTYQTNTHINTKILVFIQ